MDGAVVQSWRQSTYAAFVIQFLLAFGVIFELPVAVFLLARLGLVTARGLWGFFRYALVIIFIVAALLTPGPDPVSQLLMALPLCALYGVSIGVCWMAEKRGA
jgi:sec-independent protein translocase protein TatC